jgi:hypothetical protein
MDGLLHQVPRQLCSKSSVIFEYSSKGLGTVLPAQSVARTVAEAIEAIYTQLYLFLELYQHNKNSSTSIRRAPSGIRTAPSATRTAPPVIRSAISCSNMYICKSYKKKLCEIQ